MAQLEVLTKRKRSITRLTRNSKIFKSIIKAIQDKKGENIVSLDLRKIDEAVTFISFAILFVKYVFCTWGTTIFKTIRRQ